MELCAASSALKVRDYVPEELANFAEALANPRALAPSRSSSCVNPPQPGQLPNSGNNSSALNAEPPQPAPGAMSPKQQQQSDAQSPCAKSEAQIVYRMDSDDSLDINGKEARKSTRTASAGNAAALVVNPPGPHSSGTVRKISARFRNTSGQSSLQQQQAGAQAAASSLPAAAAGTSAFSPPTLTGFISSLISSVQNQLGGSHHSSKASSSSGSAPGSGPATADPKQHQPPPPPPAAAQQQQQMHEVSIRRTNSPAASAARRSSAMPSSSQPSASGAAEAGLLGGMSCGLLSTRLCSTPEMPRRSGATSAATSPNLNSSPIPRSPGSQRSLGSAALAVRTSLTPPFGGVGQMARLQLRHLDISREREQIVATLAEGSLHYSAIFLECEI